MIDRQITASGPCLDVDPLRDGLLCGVWSFKGAQPPPIALEELNRTGLALFAGLAKGTVPYAPEQLPQSLESDAGTTLTRSLVWKLKQEGPDQAQPAGHFSNFTGAPG